MPNTALLLDEAAHTNPDAPFVVGEGSRLAYAAVHRRAGLLARVLRTDGVAPGDRIAVMMPNEIDLPWVVYGVMKVGAVPVMLSVSAPAAEVATALRTVEATACIAGPAQAITAQAGCHEVPTCRAVWVTGVEAVGAARALAPALSEAASPLPTHPTRDDDPALILFTSGTTGTPKGAVVTHANIRHFARFFEREFWRVGRDDVLLMIAPNAHIIGQCVLHTACAAGAALRPLQAFEPHAFLRIVETDRVSFFAGVPALGHLLLGATEEASFDLSSLRTVMLGGAPVTPDLIDAMEQALGARVLVGYGMTEAAPISYVSADMQAPPHTVGKAIWGTDLRIVGDDGRELERGARGEVWMRGPQLFKGYFGETTPTDRDARDGWFATGDVGYLNDDGYLFLVDRLKHLIKASGYAVYPAEVERVLGEHPAVAEAVVLGRPHPTLGETVHAFIAPRPGSGDVANGDGMNAAAIERHCAARLATYKVPRSFTFLDRLPRMASGKADRKGLARRLADDAPAPSAATPPADPTAAAEALAREVLGFCPPAHTNLYDTEAGSIRIAELALHARERYGSHFDTEAFLRRPSLTRLAHALSADGAAPPPLPEDVRRIAAQQTAPPSAPASLRRFADADGFARHWARSRPTLVNRLRYWRSFRLVKAFADLAGMPRPLSEVLHESLFTNTARLHEIWTVDQSPFPPRVALHGAEPLEAALGARRPVLLVVSHSAGGLGLFQLLNERDLEAHTTIIRRQALAVQQGWSPETFRAVRNTPSWPDLQQANLTRQLTDAYLRLEQNGIAVIAGDGRLGRTGRYLPFHGRACWFGDGFARMAEYNAPEVFATFDTLAPDGTVHMHVAALSPPPPGLSDEARIAHRMEAYAAQLAAFWRLHLGGVRWGRIQRLLRAPRWDETYRGRTAP